MCCPPPLPPPFRCALSFAGRSIQMIEPVADQLSIPRRNIFANRLVFDDDADNDGSVGSGTGKYVGFDAGEPTSRDGGKPKVVGL